MEFLILKNEKKVSDLVTRAFGKLNAADAKRAESSLLRANPHLVSIDRFKAGTPVVIPRLPGLVITAKSETTTPAAQPIFEGVDQLRNYLSHLDSSMAKQAGLLKEQTGLLKSAELKKAATQVDIGPHLVTSATAAIKTLEGENLQIQGWLKEARNAVEELKNLAKAIK